MGAGKCQVEADWVVGGVAGGKGLRGGLGRGSGSGSHEEEEGEARSSNFVWAVFEKIEEAIARRENV